MERYGPLAATVSMALAIMASGAAIASAWRGKRRWAPVEQELRGAADKISVLLAAVTIVVLYVSFHTGHGTAALTGIVIGFAAATLILFGGYQYLFGRFTFRINKGRPRASRVVGGTQLTQQAADAKRDRKFEDDEDLLPGFANDPIQVWTRSSRELIKTVLNLAYALLVFVGTTTLGAAAIRLSVAVRDLT